MKIAKAVRDAYHSRKGVYERLSEDICTRLSPELSSRGWLFTSRVKQLESYALKIETGRVDDPSRMEDFFACTIIVPTLSQASLAEQLLEEIYEVHTRRPASDEATHKKASDFVFDDLRLYLKRRGAATGRNDDLDGVIFEVQIKTVLQYAWGIASHDLIYKTDTVSWSKERIAFQVKAMLEHAEIAIAEAERLAESPAIAKRDQETVNILEVIQIIRNFWAADRLPSDIKRLADSILRVMYICDLKASELEPVLITEKRRIGILPANLSPYAFLVQALAHSTDHDFKGRLTNSRNRKVKILVHGDMDLPAWMKEPNDKIIRV